MSDYNYTLGFLDGYLNREAKGKDDPSFYDKSRAYWDILSDNERNAIYAGLAGLGGLTGAGLGSLVTSPKNKVLGATIGAGSGMIALPAVLYLLKEFANKTKK